MKWLPMAAVAATLAASSPLLHGAEPTAASDPLIKRGKLLFLQCAACHSVQADVETGIGPNLGGIMGRAAASLPGFHYSPALTQAGLTWNEATLDDWIQNPNAVAPGTYMIFSGIPKAEDRQAVIAYLRAATSAR